MADESETMSKQFDAGTAHKKAIDIATGKCTSAANQASQYKIRAKINSAAGGP